MNQWSLSNLDFLQVQEMVKKYAVSDLGKQEIKKIVPSASFQEVSERLQDTKEGMDFLRIKGEFSLEGICYIQPALHRAEVGGMLSEGELWDIHKTLAAGRRIKRWIQQVHEKFYSIPRMNQLAEQVTGLKELSDAIERCIDDQGNVRDEASPSLKKVRIQIRQLKERIQQTLNELIHRPSIQKMLQEPIITQRHHRYVVPIKQEYRGQFKGMIHDQSSSGATLFIEPEIVVLLNNQLHEKEDQEQKEIEKILMQLTEAVGKKVSVLRTNVKALTAIDVIVAKALFAEELKAVCPQLIQKNYMKLKKARHPLLSMENVVPNDVFMGESYQGIIITGPNTGGKTVTLKTIGLLALMTQAGFPIPVEKGSVMPVYSGIFADIGDEQSIEQNLSTFSGHITQIIQILQRMDQRSLVLFDELGAGTDPTEGAALAIAILEYVLDQGASVVATTHYSELKLFAHRHPKTVNASVEFDVNTLQPTYQLMIGVPGRSNAFDIAERLGLSTQITEKARSHLSHESLRLEEMITSMANEKQEASKLRKEAAEMYTESEKLFLELQEKIASWDREKQRIKREAQQEARQMVLRAKKEANQILRDMRRWATSQTTHVKEHEWVNKKQQLDQIVLPEVESEPIRQQVEKQDLQIHDEVLVLPYQQNGTIIEKVDDQHFVVQVGQLKMRVERGQLKKQNRSKKTSISQPVIQQKTSPIRPELDVRGKKVEEALPEIDKYLDSALLSGYKQVFLIHGKGTGALRSGIQAFLRNHPSVKSFRLGSYGEGGSGVTVIEFD